MESLLSIALSNAVVATMLAVVALVAGRLCRRPAGRGAVCRQANVLNLDGAAHGRPVRPQHRDCDQGPSRSLRRHPCGADRGSHGVLCDCRSLSAPARPDGRWPHVAVPGGRRLRKAFRGRHPSASRNSCCSVRARRNRGRNRRRRSRERGRSLRRGIAVHAGEDGLHHPPHLRHRLRAALGRGGAAPSPRPDGRHERRAARHRFHRLGQSCSIREHYLHYGHASRQQTLQFGIRNKLDFRALP